MGAIERGLVENLGLAPHAALDAMKDVVLEDEVRTKAQRQIAAGLIRADEPVPEALDASIAREPRFLGTYAAALPVGRMNAIVDRCMTEHPPEVTLSALREAPEAVRRHAIATFVSRRKKIKRTTDARVALASIPGAAAIIEDNLEGVDPGEKKFFRILEKSFAKDVYAKLAAKAGRKVESTMEILERLSRDDGGTTLFFPATGELEPLLQHTHSYVGATPPPGVQPPQGREEDMKHILSLDLSSFPDLVREFGGETLSLFVEAAGSGEFNDDATLVCSGTLDAIPDGGQPLPVGVLKLPAALRESGRTTEHADLRSILRRCDGVAFGPAYWTQRSLGTSVTLQINDAYINLGDCGSLYIGDFGTTWQGY